MCVLVHNSTSALVIGSNCTKYSSSNCKTFAEGQTDGDSATGNNDMQQWYERSSPICVIDCTFQNNIQQIFAQSIVYSTIQDNNINKLSIVQYRTNCL